MEMKWNTRLGLRLLSCVINTLTQNGCHFSDHIFKHIFFNENVWISIKISLKLASRGLINNNPALVQIMPWSCTGDKTLMRHSASMSQTMQRFPENEWVKIASNTGANAFNGARLQDLAVSSPMCYHGSHFIFCTFIQGMLAHFWCWRKSPSQQHCVLVPAADLASHWHNSCIHW